MATATSASPSTSTTVAANAETSTITLPTGRYSPDTLAAYLDVSLSTIDSWHSSGCGPPLVKLGKPVRTTVKDVEIWRARPLERSPG